MMARSPGARAGPIAAPSDLSVVEAIEGLLGWAKVGRAILTDEASEQRLRALVAAIPASLRKIEAEVVGTGRESGSSSRPASGRAGGGVVGWCRGSDRAREVVAEQTRGHPSGPILRNPEGTPRRRTRLTARSSGSSRRSVASSTRGRGGKAMRPRPQSS